MRFFKRNLYAFMVLAAGAVGMGLVHWQLDRAAANHQHHREDFILLDLAGEVDGATHLYQVLVQSLRHQSESSLLEDASRLAEVMQQHTPPPPPQGLVAKYHRALQAELKYREKDRIREALRRLGR